MSASPGEGDRVNGGNATCSACGTASPCEEQGICLDPTVFRIGRSGDTSDSAVASAGPGGGEAFLIEGQLVVRAPDGGWVPAVVPLNTSHAAKGRDTVLADAQVTALGLPADPDEARAFLIRAQADAVSHGDHLDFVVNGRLLHIVDDAVSDCGASCAGAVGHDRGAAVVDHGGLDVVRARERVSAAASAAFASGGAFGGGEYMPLAVSSLGSGDTTAEGALSQKAVAHLVAAEHAGGAEASTHTRLKVLGICCPSEVPLIHSILDKRAGVRSVKVIVPTKTVLVEHASKTATASQLVDALNAARLQASLSRSEARWKAETVVDVAATGWDDGLGPTPTTVPYEKRTLWSVVTSWHAKTFPDGSLPPWPTQVACLCLFLLPFSAASSEARGLRYVALLAVVVGLPPIARKAFGSLRNRVVDMNTLMSLSVVGACALGYFGEAAAVVALHGVSEWLEARAMGEAGVAMGAVLSLRPERARRLAAPDLEVEVEEIKVGETVLVRPGDVVPLDGIVVAGASAVNEAALTGESVPVPKRGGDAVCGGTVNQGGALEIKVTAVAGDSAVSKLVRLVEEAQAARSSTERAVETFAKHYTPLVVLVAFLIATTPYALAGATGPRYLYTACVLLVVACPCALVLSTPVVSVCGLTKAARRGMLVKGSAHLESLARCAAACVDKTGTLTEGRFAMTEVRLASPVAPTGGFEKKLRPALGAGALLRWACALESRASHPVAAAVMAGSGAAVRVAAARCAVSRFAILPGEGAAGTVDGRAVEVGGPALASRRGWRDSDPALASAVDRWEKAGATAVWVGVDGVVAGALRCEDATRASSPRAAGLLRAAGVRVVMLTGDNRGSARRVAAHCGIAEADTHYGLTPEQKMRFVTRQVEALESERRADDAPTASPREKKWFFSGRRFAGRATLAMVGDGINDAPALGAADIGVAMGVAGAAAAMETADVALLTNDLARLAETVSLGRECVRKIRQNIAFSVAAKALVLALSLAGVTGLAVAVVADVGTSIVVILNGMTVLRDERASGGARGSEREPHRRDEKKRVPAKETKRSQRGKGSRFRSALGAPGRAALRPPGESYFPAGDAEADSICLLVEEENSGTDSARTSKQVEMVDVRDGADESALVRACTDACCGGGSGGKPGAFGPFDASRLHSPLGSRPGSSASLNLQSGTSSPRASPPSAPAEVAVVVAAEAPPSPSRRIP